MLVKKNPPTPPLLPILNGQYQDGWNTSLNQMKNTPPFHIIFHVLKVLLIKICKIIQPIFYFLLFYISFYITRHHFSQIFRTSFNIIWKKIFCLKFPLFNGFTQTPYPLNGQNPLSVTKVFCWCSLKARMKLNDRKRLNEIE